jgi:hypothetical protein
VLFANDRAVLVVDQFDVYPAGIEFRVSLMLADLLPRNALSTPFDQRMTAPEDLVQLGVQYADGAKWTNLAEFPRPDEPPPPLVVFPGDSGGGLYHWRAHNWMWPLPPDGPVTFVAAWPKLGIPESSVVVDGTELRSLAAKAQALWTG